MIRRDVIRTAALQIWFALTFVLSVSHPANADDKEALLAFLFDAPHRMADSLLDMPAIEPVEKAFTAALKTAMEGDIAAARQHASAAGYELAEKAVDSRGYVVLVERDRAGIGPTVAIARNPVREVVIEAPHPIKDKDTDRQAAVLFVELGARALVLSGANRCASKTDSPCSGKTRICGDGRNSYRTSDPAHNPATLFHVAHRVFTRAWPRSIAFQPHGFSNSDNSVWFVISDGTKERRSGDTMLTGRVRDAVRAAVGKERAVSCQDPDDRSIKTRWLCATTTVQGRDLNGSPNICRKRADKPSGRFLHIEQTYDDVRKGFGQDWKNLNRHPGSTAILAALKKELPCINAGCAPVN
jgi:hypothetical protein